MRLRYLLCTMLVLLAASWTLGPDAAAAQRNAVEDVTDDTDDDGDVEDDDDDSGRGGPKDKDKDKDKPSGRAPGASGRPVDPGRSGVDDARKQIASAKAQEVKGALVFVDPSARLIELQGPVFALDRRTRVTNLQGEQIDLATFIQRAIELLDNVEAELPLVLVDVRSGSGELGVATRIRLVDDFGEFRVEEDRVLAPLVAVNEGTIELLGPAFQVAAGAELKSRGEPIDFDGLLGLLEAAPAGSLPVRLEARPAAAIDAVGLPIVHELKVDAPAGEVVIRGGVERDDRQVKGVAGLAGLSPPDGETSVGFENDDGDIEATLRVSFDKQVRQVVRDDAFLFELFPQAEDEEDLQVSRDGKEISLDVILLPETTYQLVVGVPGLGHFFSVFSTGDVIPQTTLQGAVTFPETDLNLDAVSIDESFVVISTADPTDLLADDNEDPYPLLEQATAVVPLGRTYQASGLPEDDYYVLAFIVVEAGGEEFFLTAIFDEDADGVADAVSISAAAPDAVADLTVQLPEAFAVVQTAPAHRESGVDLATTIEITFNRVVDEWEDLEILPEPVEMDGLELSDDGLSLLVDVELEDNTVYSVLLEGAEDEDEDGLVAPLRFVFGTGDSFPAGTIDGRLFLPADLPLAQRIIEGAAVVELYRAGDDEAPRRTVLTFDGAYDFTNVPDGDWTVDAFVEIGLPRGLRPGKSTGQATGDRRGPTVPSALASRVNDGGFDIVAPKPFDFREIPNGFDRVEFFGYYDADADGEADVLSIVDGAAQTDIDIYLKPLKQHRDEILTVRARARGQRLRHHRRHCARVQPQTAGQRTARGPRRRTRAEATVWRSYAGLRHRR